ncbi:MAG TPA: hypothetical protein VFY91_12655 [Microbacterium sp.]|nr:hypothetical protein [Microbacterium sp.]
MPSEVRDAVSRLREAMATAVPPKLLDRNLLIATWRWPMVLRLSPVWISPESGSAERDLRSVQLLAEVVRHFDVIAIQGVMGNAPTVLAVIELLGPEWAFLMTGLSRETTYRERTAIIFDTRKVLPQGLAGQIVLPQQGKRASGDDDLLSEQFFRPPFFAGFRCLSSSFTLVNQHIVFGTEPERVREIQALARWIAEVRAGAYWEGNLLVLGQLQLLRDGSPVHRAFTQAGLRLPPGLVGTTTYVSSNGRRVNQASAVAWIENEAGQPDLDFPYRSAGVFDYTALFGDSLGGYDYLSQHLPVWVEFKVVPSHREAHA